MLVADPENSEDDGNSRHRGSSRHRPPLPHIAPVQPSNQAPIASRRASGRAKVRREVGFWRFPRPRPWRQYVSRPQSEAESLTIRRHGARPGLRR